MQRYNDPPRETLTEAQALSLLQGGSHIRTDFGARRLNLDLSVAGIVPILGGSIRHNMNAPIHTTCDLEIDADYDWGTTLVQPYMDLTDDRGITGRWYVGVFSLTSPSGDYGQRPRRRRVQGYDRIYLLSREIGDTWVAPSGAGVLAEVQRVIAAAGLTGVLLDSTASAKVLPEAMTWPLVRQQQASGSGGGGQWWTIPAKTTTPDPASDFSVATYLRPANDLLFSIGYRGLYADLATGLLRSEPYVNPSQRPIEHVFNFDDPLNSIVSPMRTLVEDRYKATNRWVFIRQNMPGTPPAQPSVGDGIYIVDESDGDPRGVWSKQFLLDVVDQASLVSQGDNQVASDKRVQSKLTVKTAPFPAAGHADVYRYIDAEMDKDVHVQETEWTLDLQGADMTRSWEVV